MSLPQPLNIDWEVRSPEDKVLICIKTVSPNLPKLNRLFLCSQYCSLLGAPVKQKFSNSLRDVLNCSRGVAGWLMDLDSVEADLILNFYVYI